MGGPRRSGGYQPPVYYQPRPVNNLPAAKPVTYAQGFPAASNTAPVVIPAEQKASGGHATVSLDEWKQQNEALRAKLLEKHQMIQTANAFSNAAKDLKEQIPGIGALSGLLGGSKTAEAKTTKPTETPTAPQTTGATVPPANPSGSTTGGQETSEIEEETDAQVTEPTSVEQPEPEVLKPNTEEV